MSKTEDPFEMIQKMHAMLAGRSLIVASREDIARLRSEDGVGTGESWSMIESAADLPLPPDSLRDVRVLVIEVDTSSDASLHRLTQLRADHPQMSIIVALRDASISAVRMLVRHGVTDVTQLPFVPETLAAQILDALSAQAEQLESDNLAPLITVVQATGGSGATTLLTHLAQALARTRRASQGVCLVDLDLQGGDVASYLGEAPKVSVGALLDAGSRLDAELVRSALTETRYGFSLLAAPNEIRPIDTIDTDHLLTTLRLARSMFGHVLVDLPPTWNNWSLSAVKASDKVLLLTDTSIASLRQAKRRLALFDEIDVPRSHVEIVVNRMARKLFRSINEDDVKGTLGRDVSATLPPEADQLREVQDEGRLITDSGSKSRYAQSVDGLADMLLGKLEAEWHG